MHLLNIECLVVFSRDISNIAPFSNLQLLILTSCVAKQRLNSEPVGSPRHEIGDDALVSLSFIYLSKLFNVVHLDPNAIL